MFPTRTTAVTCALARDQEQVAGSSTVLPYASIVAGAFGEDTEAPTPADESGGFSAGLERVCEGVGETAIDIANSSRGLRPAGVEACAANGVEDIIEVRLGHDGIVFASRQGGPAFTGFARALWYQAFAAVVPGEDGAMMTNPNANWSEVDDDLPGAEIVAFIPGTKHGTCEVFGEKALLTGCEDSGAMERMAAAGMDEDSAEAARMAVRTDGASVDIDRDATETPSRIGSNPNEVGVFGRSIYENDQDRLKVATMNGLAHTTETISTGEYPVGRPLYFHVKGAHIDVIPGLKEYPQFFVADEIAGPGGTPAEYGLVPDPEPDAVRRTIEDEVSMSGEAS